MTKILLNLGCGSVPLRAPKRAGGTWVVINHDLWVHSPHVDAAWDLNRLPWPWGDGSLALVRAYAVLEHLQLTLVESCNECWRILKPGGRLEVKLPLWDKDEAWGDPTHRWHFGRHTLDVFDPTTERGGRYGALYGVRPWRLVYQGTVPQGTGLYGQLEALK